MATHEHPPSWDGLEGAQTHETGPFQTRLHHCSWWLKSGYRAYPVHDVEFEVCFPHPVGDRFCVRRGPPVRLKPFFALAFFTIVPYPLDRAVLGDCRRHCW